MSYTADYKPQNLNQCLFPNKTTEDIIWDIAGNFTDANLVLHGPMGTGKSLMARLIGDELEKIRAATFHIFQGALLRTPAKVEALIEKLDDWNRTYNAFASRRLYIIEEFDRVHFDSQLGFGHVMTTDDVQFILTTNEVQDIDKRVLSRAQLCHISGATQADMLKLAQDVVAKEGVMATDSELFQVAVSSGGNVRDLMHGLEGLVLRKRRQLGLLASGQHTVQGRIPPFALVHAPVPTVSLLPQNTHASGAAQPTP